MKRYRKFCIKSKTGVILKKLLEFVVSMKLGVRIGEQDSIKIENRHENRLLCLFVVVCLL